MSLLLEKYTQLYNEMSGIRSQIQEAEEEIAQLIRDQEENNVPARIEHLEKQLKKIDDCELRIKEYLTLAEKCITSKNLLTIEVPDNYRINMNRLHRYACMIDPHASYDPSAPDDPYAQKLYLIGNVDLKFLGTKKEEFTVLLEQLKKDAAEGNSYQLRVLNEKIETLQKELKEYAYTAEIQEFAQELVAQSSNYFFSEAKDSYEVKYQDPPYFAPGAYGLPLRFEHEERDMLKEQMGRFYDHVNGRVYLPLELMPTDEEFAITVSCIPSRKRIQEMDAGIRNMLLTIADQSHIGKRKIIVLDAERLNTTLLGSARKLNDSFIMDSIPRTEEQIDDVLTNLVSSFTDIDDIIGDFDSVVEYNNQSPAEKQLTRTVLVMVGWPEAFQGHNRELLRRVMANYERYGISFISISIKEGNTNQKSFGLSSYMAENSVHIAMNQKDTIVTIGENDYKFSWYTFNGDLNDNYVKSFKSHVIKKESLGNEYTKRFDIVNLPEFTRQYKPIELPYGIDNKEALQSVSFENENFAAYLVGASRSGKSTLLHTLIAGLIRNYHPDNVELWLADFKQLEFEKYIHHLPPHVKYVLLDESQELVFDLIDKLTEKMMERQQLFARLGKERIDQIDPTTLDKPLPVIFVILDEFSIMSQQLEQSEDYKLRLQNLLAKGAALGIRFLFSSQTFTSGVRGLTATARAQIQQRISMKASKEEITETLELSPNLRTEQVRNWMDALPPHYALIKFRNGADSLPEVRRSLVLYFEDYEPRNQMIHALNDKFTAVDVYNPNQIDTYVDKNPVLVDGKTYQKFDQEAFTTSVKEYKKSGDYFEDEVYVSLGTPRLMVDERFITLTQESRENMILIAKHSEQACAASILTSAMKSFEAQGKTVQIWAYGKNKLYRAYKSVWEKNNVKMVVGNDAVCDAIRELKEKIGKKQTSDELIVMIGMDRICSDFEFNEAMSLGGNKKIPVVQVVPEEAKIKNDDDLIKQEYAQKLMVFKRNIKKELRKQGKSPDEIKEIVAAESEKFKEEFMKQYQITDHETYKPEETIVEKPVDPVSVKEDNNTSEEQKTGAYNAKDDFLYIMQQGSRLGYHFFMELNNLSDLKQTFVKLDLFRHRLGFQVSREISFDLFGYRYGDELPEHICQYYDTLERFSFRPYLNYGISWDGWIVNEQNELLNPFLK